MPMMVRGSGVSFTDDEIGHCLTFSKRCSELFDAASDLNTLTGARIVVVLESKNNVFSSFGTPEADPIVDAFLHGDVPTKFDTSEEQKGKITILQNELFQLEKEKAIEYKRKNDSVMHVKEIHGTSRIAKYVYGKIEDLDSTELCEMYHELSQIKKDINDCLSRWHSVPSHVVTVPKYSP